MGLLHSRFRLRPDIARHEALSARSGVSGALKEVNSGDGRQAHQLIEREDQRAVDQTVDHQTMLARVDIWRIITVIDNEVERSRRDDSEGVLEGSPEPVVAGNTRARVSAEAAVGANARRGHESRAHAIVVPFVGTPVTGCGCLRGRGVDHSRTRQTRQGCTSFQKSPAIFLLGIHGSS
jgi:hypothetical protein